MRRAGRYPCYNWRRRYLGYEPGFPCPRSRPWRHGTCQSPLQPLRVYFHAAASPINMAQNREKV